MIKHFPFIHVLASNLGWTADKYPYLKKLPEKPRNILIIWIKIKDKKIPFLVNNKIPTKNENPRAYLMVRYKGKIYSSKMSSH